MDACVAVVDDSPVARVAIINVLQEMGLREIVEAGSASEAFDLIAGSTPDLFLLDLSLPDRDGTWLCQKIKRDKRFEDVPILFVTASEEVEVLEQAFAAGASDYIRKPFHNKELRIRIETHLRLLSHARRLRSYGEKMEELAASRAEQMVHRERLTTLGVLSADIVHEINNPLTYISGHAQFIKKSAPMIREALRSAAERGGDPSLTVVAEGFEDAASGIWEGVSITRSIIDNIRQFARRTTEHQSLQAVSLREALNRAVVIIRHRFDEHTDLRVDVPEDLPAVAGDVNRLAQVFVNLLANAADAMRGRERSILSICATDLNGTIRCTVKDNGPGMDDATRQHLFDPFFSTKDASTGTGLGLGICRQIVKEFGGKIFVRSAPGEGAEFSLLFRSADKLQMPDLQESPAPESET